MPIQLNEENGGKILAVHVSRNLVKADYEHFVPEFERLAMVGEKKRAARHDDILQAVHKSETRYFDQPRRRAQNGWRKHSIL